SKRVPNISRWKGKSSNGSPRPRPLGTRKNRSANESKSSPTKSRGSLTAALFGPALIAKTSQNPLLKIPQCGITVKVLDRKSTRLNSSHVSISYAVFCLKKKKKIIIDVQEVDRADNAVEEVALVGIQYSVENLRMRSILRGHDHLAPIMIANKTEAAVRD